MSNGYNFGQASTLSPEMFAEQQDLNRQQRMAQMLMQQGQQAPQGQMISGRYVPPSIFQNLASLAQTGAGAYLQQKGDERALELSKALKKEYTSELNQFNELLSKNPMEAYSFAAQANSPQLQKVGMEKMIPKEFDLPEGVKRFVTMPDGTIKEIASGGEKFQRPIEVPTGTGTQLLDARTLKSLSFIPKVKSEGESVNPQEAPLRNQFLSQIQPHIQVTQAYGKIVSAPDSAAGDMSKIFGFMKILDPGSTVREGEYASAEQTRGIPESVVAQYNRAISGKRLTTEQREKFDQASGDLITSQKKQFDQQKQFFTNVAANAKANPANIIFDPYENLEIKVTPPKKETPPSKGFNFFGNAPAQTGWSVKSVK
jgi:hypothetical protein